MTKRGRIASLIGGGAGACKFEVAQRRRTCKRCGNSIERGINCAKVSVPSTMGSKCYCLRCFGDVLRQTQQSLNSLVAQLEELQ
jgi:hypothetical protein